MKLCDLEIRQLFYVRIFRPSHRTGEIRRVVWRQGEFPFRWGCTNGFSVIARYCTRAKAVRRSCRALVG